MTTSTDSASPAPPVSFELRLPAQLDSVRLARRMLVELLASGQVAGGVVRDAELVLHELVLNGVTHGRPDERGQIEIWCAVGPEHVDVRVRDDGTGGTVAPRPWSDDRPSGRGLTIVAAVCESWCVDRSHGTCVSARLSR